MALKATDCDPEEGLSETIKVEVLVPIDAFEGSNPTEIVHVAPAESDDGQSVPA